LSANLTRANWNAYIKKCQELHLLWIWTISTSKRGQRRGRDQVMRTTLSQSEKGM
jgi:hypothetical protein